MRVPKKIRYDFTVPRAKSGEFQVLRVDAVREYHAPDGERFIERATEPIDFDSANPTATGPVFWALYGADSFGDVLTHISDGRTLRGILTLARKLGGRAYVRD